MPIRNYRLMIEGCPYEWVTSIDLAGTSDDGRVRLAGLQFDGLKLAEEYTIGDPIVARQGINFRIVHPDAFSVFYTPASAVCQLGNRLMAFEYGSNQTVSIVVNTISNLDLLIPGTVLHIGTEALLIDDVDTIEGHDDWRLLHVYQCHWDTQYQDHYLDVDYETEGDYGITHDIALYDRPLSLLKRRAYLFEYDDSVSDELRYFQSGAEIMTVNPAPATQWEYGDLITGQTSGTTCIVGRFLGGFSEAGAEYLIGQRTGAYTDGEVIGVSGVAGKLADQAADRPIFRGAYGTWPYSTDRLIWRGIVTAPPALAEDGLSFTLPTAALAETLNQRIGRDRTYSFAGVYRPKGFACAIQVTGDPWGSYTNDRLTRRITGYFSSVSAFIDAINAALADIVDKQDSGKEMLESLTLNEGDGGFYIDAETLSTGPYNGRFSFCFYDVAIGSTPFGVDDAFDNSTDKCWQYINLVGGGEMVSTGDWDSGSQLYRMYLTNTNVFPQDQTGALIPTSADHPSQLIGIDPPEDMTTNTAMWKLDGPGTLCTVSGELLGFMVGEVILVADHWGFSSSDIGRSITISGASNAGNNGTFEILAASESSLGWANASGVSESFPGTWLIEETNNTNRVNTAFVSDGLVDILSVAPVKIIKVSAADDDYADVTITSYDTGPDSVSWDSSSARLYAGAGAKIISYVLPISGSIVSAMALATALETLVTESPTSSLGVHPFFPIADLDLASFYDYFTELSSYAYGYLFTGRTWSLEKAVSLRTLLSEELKFNGARIGYDSTGAMQIVFGTSWAPDTYPALTDSMIVLTGGAKITYSSNKYSIKNAIKLTETVDGSDYIYNILGVFPNGSASQHGLDIAPLAKANSAMSAESAASLAAHYMSVPGMMRLLGSDYVVITIPILASYRDTFPIGTFVALTSAYVANFKTGSYGVTAETCLVVGRNFDLDPRKGAYGTVSLLMSLRASMVP